MLTGENGSGKTSLLEAVFLMGHGRSFRQARDAALTRWNSAEFSIHGTWMRYGPLYVEICGHGKGAAVRLQGRQVQRRTELAEMLPVLVESPQGARLVDGAPGERRRWLDRMMLYCRQDVARHYRIYLRCLMQRSRLLRKDGAGEEIGVWEQQMVAHGLAVMQARAEILEEINRELAAERGLSEADVHMKMHATAPAIQEKWLEQLAAHRTNGRIRGILRTGPHCDRLLIAYGGRDIRLCGSRGQQKLVAAAVRLAECALRMQHRGSPPVLLLDDCLEALDPGRQKRLLERLAEYSGQVFMTGPAGMRLPEAPGMDCYVLSAADKKHQGGMQMLIPSAGGMEEAA